MMLVMSKRWRESGRDTENRLKIRWKLIDLEYSEYILKLFFHIDCWCTYHRKLNTSSFCLNFPGFHCLHCHYKERRFPQVKFTIKRQFIYKEMWLQNKSTKVITTLSWRHMYENY